MTASLLGERLPTCHELEGVLAVSRLNERMRGDSRGAQDELRIRTGDVEEGASRLRCLG
jgi:hypothetical protein